MIVTTFAACLGVQLHILNGDALVKCFAHVIHSQSCHRGRHHGFHFYTYTSTPCFALGLCSGLKPPVLAVPHCTIMLIVLSTGSVDEGNSAGDDAELMLGEARDRWGFGSIAERPC